MDKTPQTNDPVHHPSHYCHGDFETASVIDAILDDANLNGSINFWYGNFLKYAMRWPFKGQTPTERIRDLQKAIECAERTITAYEKDRARASAHVAEPSA